MDVILCGHLENSVLVYAVPCSQDAPSELLAWHSSSGLQEEKLGLMASLAVCTVLSFCSPSCGLAQILHEKVDSPWAAAQRDLVSLACHLGRRLPKRVVSNRLPTGGTQQLLDLAGVTDRCTALIVGCRVRAARAQAIFLTSVHLDLNKRLRKSNPRAPPLLGSVYIKQGALRGAGVGTVGLTLKPVQP